MMKSRRMGWAGHVAVMGKMMNAYRLLVGKQGRNRPLGRLTHRWVDIMKMDVAEIGWGGMEWIDKMDVAEIGWGGMDWIDFA
jgi:hypothetical protein